MQRIRVGIVYIWSHKALWAIQLPHAVAMQTCCIVGVHVWISRIVHKKSTLLQDVTDGSQHHVTAAFSL